MKAPPKSSWLRASSGSIGIAVNVGGRKISALCSGPMPACSSRSPTASAGRGRGDQQPSLVRGAGAAEVLELEIPVVVAGDGEQCVEVAVPDRLGRLVMVVGPRDARPIVAVRRLGGRVRLGVRGEDERRLDRDDRVGAEVLGLDVHRDLPADRRCRTAERMVGTIVTATIAMASSSVVMRKARPRTRTRYSRRATCSAFGNRSLTWTPHGRWRRGAPPTRRRRGARRAR